MTTRWSTLCVVLGCLAALGACDRGAASTAPPASQTTTVSRTTSVTTTTTSTIQTATTESTTDRATVGLAASAAPPGSAASAGMVPETALVVWTAAEPPLESELVGLGQVEKWLTSAGQKVTTRAAAAEEKAFIELSAVSPDTEIPLPAAFGSSELVVVIALEPPRGKAPQRLSGGRSRLLVWHPPESVPVLSVLYDAGGAGPLGAQDLAKWLTRHLALVTEEQK